MLSAEYLEKIKKTNLGRCGLMTTDMLSIRDYADRRGADNWFYMITLAYKLGFARGRRAGKREAQKHED